MEKQTVERDQEIIFTNWTTKDFEGMWAKKIYKLAAGKAYYLPFYLAEHFAKHLVDRELNEKKLPTNHFSRQELIDKCVTILEVKPEDVGFIRPKEVPMKEVVLNRDERAKELKDKYGVEGMQVNQKALEQAKTGTDEFAPLDA